MRSSPGPCAHGRRPSTHGHACLILGGLASRAAPQRGRSGSACLGPRTPQISRDREAAFKALCFFSVFCGQASAPFVLSTPGDIIHLLPVPLPRCGCRAVDRRRSRRHSEQPGPGPPPSRAGAVVTTTVAPSPRLRPRAASPEGGWAVSSLLPVRGQGPPSPGADCRPPHGGSPPFPQEPR